MSLPIHRFNMTEPAATFWMRSISFVRLRNLARLVARFPEGISVQDLESLARTEGVLTLEDGSQPSKTTYYHYRNTLSRIDVVKHNARKLTINWDLPEVNELLTYASATDRLALLEKECLAALVVAQPDCRKVFFDLFWCNEEGSYRLNEWRASATPIVWRAEPSAKHRVIRLSSLETRDCVEAELVTPNQIQAFLYGVRYWTRDELQIVDEIFREDIGNIMFAVLPHESISDSKVKKLILQRVDPSSEWTRLSVRDVAMDLGINMRVPLIKTHLALLDLRRKHPGHMMFIPTSRSFATLTAGSGSREQLELRSYLKDERNQVISHIRIHRAMKEF